MDSPPTAAKADPTQAHVAAELEHGAPLIACRFHPGGNLVFAASEDRSVVRWDLSSGEKAAWTGHEAWPLCLACAPGGAAVVSGGSDDTLLWWEAAGAGTGPARRLAAHKGWIRAVAISPDGAVLASAGNDRVIRLWNLADGSPRAGLAGHERDVYSLLFHPAGRFLVSGDLMGKILVWDLETGQQAAPFDAAPLHTYEGGQGVDYGGVRSLSLSRDAGELIGYGLHKASNPLGAVNEPLLLRFQWESRQLLRQQVSSGVKTIGWRALFHPDGFVVGCSGGADGGFLLFWNGEQDQTFHEFKLPGTARDMDLHPDGLRVATAHADGKLRISRLAAKEGA